MIKIASRDNKKYKLFKSLLNKKYRTKENLFFVEGLVVVKEALKVNQAEYIALSDTLETETIEEITREVGEEKVYIFKEELFIQLTDTKNSQGIIGYFKPVHKENIKDIEEGRYLFLDDLQDPGNIGGLIRSVEAFGIDGIILSENTCELYNPKLLRSTMASIFRVKTYIVDKKEIQNLKNKGFKIIATSIEEASVSYKYQFPQKLVLVLGNEANGVSEEIFNIADEKIYIPMSENINSLNVNVAGSILCYEMMRC